MNKKVIIIGASFAGLSCAKTLGGSDFDVLVLEKNQQIGNKVCASGVTKQDLNFISQSEMLFPLEPAFLNDGKRREQMPWGRGMISAIERPKILQKWADEIIAKYKNIEIRFNSTVKSISDDGVILADGEKIAFDFLVGADGFLSVVRRHLGLRTDKYMIAAQYLIPDFKADKFELFSDPELFGNGYAWIFPNKEFTSVGAGVDSGSKQKDKLKENLNIWLQKHSIDVSKGKFEGFLINYDYRGYKFGNVFLAGDAAGLTNGLTGKGIYCSNLSGVLIGQEILGVADDKIKAMYEDWLKEKAEDEAWINAKDHFINLKIDSFANRN